ncbi:MAG: hypothetical protein JXB08_02335 [Bacilli bacterium]|nr:hypothetical protein [Bacilli bacterium]MBN2877419.1 hypothetical protein [Bacilli bacterium]
MGKLKTKEEYFAFSKRLVVIPTEDIKKLFLKFKVKLPLFVHGFLLCETIRSKVFEEKLYNTYTDELKYRLRGYDSFSIYLLEALIEKYNLDFELSRYKELLFDFILINMDELSLKNSFVNELEQLQHNYTVDLEVVKYADFFALVKEVFYEAAGYLDGVKLKDWTDDMLNSYTLGDLKSLGKKYDVNVPRRINKARLIQILSAKFKLTPNESELLDGMSVLDLEIYAKEKGFKISIDLKKQDMIEYLKFALDMYHKPTDSDPFSYDVPLDSREEEVTKDIEEPTPEPVVEPIPEPVVVPVEEEVEEEPVVEPEPEIVPEPEPEPIVEPEPEPEQPAFEEPLPEEIIPEEPELTVPEPKQVQPAFVDDSLLSTEEKELLDEKINQIIKKFYKKRRRRRITWTILIVLLVAILGFAAYSYYYYTIVNPGSLPFGLPVFWN